jgi:hypothetical protein
MSYFGRRVVLNAEQLDFLALNFKVTQVSDQGGGCLMLLNASTHSSVVLEDDRTCVRLVWADPDTVEALKSRGNQFDCK